MFNGHLKAKFNFSHRRMKTTIDSFERSSIKKPIIKQQHSKQLLQQAKLTYYQDENYLSTINILEQYLQQKPNDNQALYLCGVSYLHLNQPIQSIKKLSRITYTFHAKQQSLLLLAMSYDKIQNSQQSLSIINQCLQKFKQFQAGFSYRGKLYLKYQQYQYAQKDFLHALKLNNKSFITRVGLGDCYYQQHQYQQAIKFYQQSIKYLYLDLNHNKNSQINQSNIKLKIAISYFQIRQYQKVIEILEKFTSKQKQLNPEVYYYVGISYLKTEKSKKKHEGILNLEYCIKLQTIQNKTLIQKAFKILIQTYLQDFQFYQAVNVLKLTDLLNDEISCKYWKNLVQGCMLIIKAHYKDGLKKVTQIHQIIKGKKNVLTIQVNHLSHKKNYPNDDNEFLQQPPTHQHGKSRQNKYFTNNKQIKSPKKNHHQQSSSNNRSKKKSFSLKHVKKNSFYEQNPNKTIFKTIDQPNHSNKPYTPSSNSVLKNYRYSNIRPQVKIKGFFNYNLNLTSLRKNVLTKQSILNHNIQQRDLENKNKKHQEKIFNDQQEVFIMPIILKFKAYAEFFLNFYLKALDTYQQYENYMKNVFGREFSDMEYNKIICEVFLLNETQMQQQCLEKLDIAITQYRKSCNAIPIQPLLYKISILLQSSIPFFYSQSTQKALSNYEDVQKTQKGYQFLQYVLDINTKYVEQLKNHHLSHYFLSILYFLCQKYDQAQVQLEKTLKIVQECSWKYLYLKGCIEILLENYYDSIKEFTAGLILQQNADLYLARSISFLLEGSKRQSLQSKRKKSINKNQFKNNSSIKMKNKKSPKHNQNQPLKKSSIQQQQATGQVFIQNSFQDLQKFIQMQTDQDKISLWVTKILFYNQAYQQSLRALQKVQNKNSELQQLQFWLKLYQGEFQECGAIGQIIMNSFEGNLIRQEQQNSVLLNNKHAQICNVLATYNLPFSYIKWLIILHLFKKQKYSILIKYIQKYIFESQSLEQEIQLRYNVGLIYFIQGQISKAMNVFQSMYNEENIQINQKLKVKLKKLINLEFQQDECVNDLAQQLSTNGNHRVSHYLPYKPVQFHEDNSTKRLFFKPSIPFPQFPKPNIQLKLPKSFFRKQLQIDNVQKRIQAPWIKKNRQKIQFTEQIVEAQTDFLKQTKEMNPVIQDYSDDNT